MKRSQLVLLTLLALTVSVTVPFLVREENDTFNQTLEVAASMIAGLSGVLTLLLAILLYQKLGIDEPLLARNTDLVFRLIEKLKTIRFIIKGDKFLLQVHMHRPFLKSFEEHYGQRLLFNVDYSEGVKQIVELANNPFMPKQIAEKISLLVFNILLYDVSEEELKSYCKVSVVGQKREDAKWGKFNANDMTLLNFLNTLEDIKVEITTWVRSKTTLDLNLNI
jgi:hypothetical protein